MMCCNRCKFLKGNTINPYQHCEENRNKILHILRTVKLLKDERRELFFKVNLPLESFVEVGDGWNDCICKDSEHCGTTINKPETFYCDKFTVDKKQNLINQSFIKYRKRKIKEQKEREEYMNQPGNTHPPDNLRPLLFYDDSGIKKTRKFIDRIMW